MPKTDPTPTTSRRRLLSGSVALSLGASVATLASCIPTPVLAATIDPDAELIRLCAEFCRLQVIVDRLDERFFALPDCQEAQATDEQVEALTIQQEKLSDQVRGMPARTQAGWIAKARVTHALFLRHHEEEIEGDFMDEETAFAWSLIGDLVAVGGQA